MNAQTLIKEQNELDEEFIRPSKYSTQERVLKVLELKSKALGYAEGLDKIDRVICPVKFTKGMENFNKLVGISKFINSELKALQEAGLIPNEL